MNQRLILIFLQGIEEEAIWSHHNCVYYTINDYATCEVPEDIGVVLEGIRVLQDSENLPFAAVILFGLIYTMNLSYPSKPWYIFEVFQKVSQELDSKHLSNKAQAFKNRLFE